MRRRSSELWLALATNVLVTLLYLAIISRNPVPAASSLLGHTLGIVGFVLMLMTETLYSLRKRSLSARWGPLATWLRLHIFSGIVGPYLVLLHTSWKFNGLAGVVTLLMVLVVGSGFLGRYIYTAVPRSADGVELEAGQIERQIAAAEAAIQHWLDARPDAPPALAQRLAELPALPPGQQGQFLLVLGRGFLEWGYRRQWRRELRHVDGLVRTQAKEIERLLRRRRLLQRQVASLALARRVLAIWHTAHIPGAMVMFTAAAIHIGAAIYYATLLK